MICEKSGSEVGMHFPVEPLLLPSVCFSMLFSNRIVGRVTLKTTPVFWSHRNISSRSRWESLKMHSRLYYFHHHRHYTTIGPLGWNQMKQIEAATSLGDQGQGYPSSRSTSARQGYGSECHGSSTRQEGHSHSPDKGDPAVRSLLRKLCWDELEWNRLNMIE